MTLYELAEVLTTPIEGTIGDNFKKYMLDTCGIDIDKVCEGIKSFLEYVNKK